MATIMKISKDARSADVAVMPAGRGRRQRGAAAERPLRVLVLSHMDPRVTKGGAEISAFQLYEELQQRSGVKAFFMSCAPGKMEARDGVLFSQPFGADNYVYAVRGFDHFIFSNPDSELRPEFAELLAEIQPDVVHLHHYTNFGLEALLAIKAAAPDARLVLTLHEFLAICNHFGQMVKRPNFGLCEKSGPRECNACFPEKTPQDFFLRELFIKRFFRLVDHFISPSRFLADRYVAWGIDPAKISVVENGVPQVEGRGTLAYPPLDGAVTFGFFGQISKLKGINVLIEAARQLDALEVSNVQIEVFGDYSSQPEEFQKEMREQLADLPANFHFRGPYANSHVDRLMQSVHAVLVPSIWWENSPVVIQEALANRRPVICSDIGGMAEKVRDGLDGFHFHAGSGRSLALLLQRLAADPQLLLGARATMVRPPSVAETTEAILGIYGGAAVAAAM